VHGFSFRIAEENLMVTDSLISGINGNNGSCVISAKIDHGNSGGATMDTSNDCFLGIPTAIACESEVYGQVIGISELQKAYPEFFRSSLSH